ncbi:MAG: hypothetical protein GY950_32090, partial [bacterium]|nr:hypothetical protein [bacterium]
EGYEGEFLKKESKLDPGITAWWKFTPNMTLNATINPDFSHVEADAAKMDVNTQFSLYYPEKRPFFLEGGTIFETRLPVVRTRSLAEANWGVKVTGKEGPHDIGFFSVQDQITNIIIPGSYSNALVTLPMRTQGTVLRYRHDIGKVSAVGAIFTDREGEDYYNRVAGFDTYLRLSDTKEIRAQFMGSQTHYPGALASEFEQSQGKISGSALELFFRHTSPKFIYFANYQQATPGFRADMGFYPQVGYRHVNGGMVFFWYRNPGHWFTQINLYPSFQYEKDFNGNLIYKTLKLDLNYKGPSQSALSLKGKLGKQTFLGNEFDISQAEVNFSIQPSGPLFLWCNATYGSEIDFNNVRQGRLFLINPGIFYKLGKRVSLLLQHEYERLDVNDQRLYSANVSNLRIIYQFS